jgi:hypothetical protein
MMPYVSIGRMDVMRDYWGNALARPIAPALLRRALKDHLCKAQNLLAQSLMHLAGASFNYAALKQVNVVLFQEGDFQYIFRVIVKPPVGAASQLALVVAKNSGPVSRTARTEKENLQLLYLRNPSFVVCPLAGGMLPVITGEKARPRNLYIYFTPWLTRFHELGVDRHLNFLINELPFHYFDRKVSDFIRAQILNICFAYYDPAAQTAMEPPLIGAGDIVITRPRAHKPYDLKLIACRKILRSITLAKCLRLYLEYHGQWGGKTFHLVPRDPALLQSALHEGLVAANPGRVDSQTLYAELEAYAADLAAEKAAGSKRWHPLPVLRSLLKLPRTSK